MFPVVQLRLSGLEPRGMYSIYLEFVQLSGHRWKYMNGDWVPGGKAEPAPQQAVYIHPESPNFGSHWMESSVSFAKVKLTNKPSAPQGQIVLNSLHKYEPRVHIVKVTTEDDGQHVGTFNFAEAEFVAVTAYQNEEVTALKIRHNPFAKAFLDGRERTEHQVKVEVADVADTSNDIQIQPISQMSNWCTSHPHTPVPVSINNTVNYGSNVYYGRLGSLHSYRSSPYQQPHKRSVVSRPSCGYESVTPPMATCSGMFSTGSQFDQWTIPGPLHFNENNFCQPASSYPSFLQSGVSNSVTVPSPSAASTSSPSGMMVNVPLTPTNDSRNFANPNEYHSFLSFGMMNTVQPHNQQSSFITQLQPFQIQQSSPLSDSNTGAPSYGTTHNDVLPENFEPSPRPENHWSSMTPPKCI
ncbi:T-box transcription factor T-like isoform X2 [Tachypleus tridentatus]